MLDTPSNTISDVRVQTFDISYEYPLVFTRDAFGSGNRSLIGPGELHVPLTVEPAPVAAMTAFRLLSPEVWSQCSYQFFVTA